jgi:hypothetical protein
MAGVSWEDVLPADREFGGMIHRALMRGSHDGTYFEPGLIIEGVLDLEHIAENLRRRLLGEIDKTNDGITGPDPWYSTNRVEAWKRYLKAYGSQEPAGGALWKRVLENA